MRASPSPLLFACFLATICLPDGTRAGENQPFIVAHRGLLLEAPENTLAGFRACLEIGIGFELDVRRSRDQQLVCIHDDTVDRTTGGEGSVSELPLEELKLLDAGSWFDPKFRGQRIPTLDEVLSLLVEFPAVDALVAVDIKAEDPWMEPDIIRLAKRHGVLDRLLMIGRAIGHGHVRRRLRGMDRQTHVACLAASPRAVPTALGDQQSDWVYIRYVPSREDVARIHAAGKRVFIAGPTVAGAESENWRRAAVRGVDAILTDHARALKHQLERIGSKAE